MQESIENKISKININHYKNKARCSLKLIENLLPICSNIDTSIQKYIKYCYQLKYKEQPNYDVIKTLFGINIYKETI